MNKFKFLLLFFGVIKGCLDCIAQGLQRLPEVLKSSGRSASLNRQPPGIARVKGLGEQNSLKKQSAVEYPGTFSESTFPAGISRFQTSGASSLN